MSHVPIPYRKISAIFLAMATLVAVIVTTGCGGSGGGNNALLPFTGWTQVGATYVGRTRCRDCHATVDDQFAQNPKGSTASNSTHSRMNTGDCAKCHVTGYGEASGGTIVAGGDSDPTNVPLSGLYGVTCESCHGPGSKHVAASTNEARKANITRIPRSSSTCYNCHSGSSSGFKLLSSPVAPVNKTTLATQNPGLRGPHHASAAAMIEGVLGYNYPNTQPSPHSTLPNACVDCHLQPKLNPATGKVDHGAQQLKPNTDTSRATCASCHGGGSRSELALQVGVKEKLITLGGEDPLNPGEPDANAGGGLLHDYQIAHNISLTTNTTPDDPFVIAYKGARYNFKYILSDHSFGVHNPGFTRKMLEDAITAVSP